jgi:type VI secretion system secreted protein VgrG
VPNILIGDGFEIDGSPIAEEKYVLLRAHHVIEVWAPTGSNDERRGYHGTYEAIPAELEYPPLRTTPWPRISGPQTAIVVGKDGEEIDVDDTGRILVKFHWDRDSQHSRRVRVAQLWAGNHWGSYFVPRIGMEVVVEFLGGDPDRPLVTGTVYNSVNMPSAKNWPEFKTESGFKSNSSKGDDGFNMIGWRDLKGEEKFYIRAEKDMKRWVKND